MKHRYYLAKIMPLIKLDKTNSVLYVVICRSCGKIKIVDPSYKLNKP